MIIGVTECCLVCDSEHDSQYPYRVGCVLGSGGMWQGRNELIMTEGQWGPASGATARPGGQTWWIPCVDDGGSSQEAAPCPACEARSLVTAVCLVDPISRHAEGTQDGCEQSVKDFSAVPFLCSC